VPPRGEDLLRTLSGMPRHRERKSLCEPLKEHHIAQAGRSSSHPLRNAAPPRQERVRPPRPFGPRASGSERPQGTEGQDAPESRSAAREGGSATVPGGPKRTRAVRKRAQGPGGLALSRRTARRQHSDHTETHGNSPLLHSINPGGSRRQKHTEAATSGPGGLALSRRTARRQHGNTRRLSASQLRKPRGKRKTKTHRSSNQRAGWPCTLPPDGTKTARRPHGDSPLRNFINPGGSGR
jgi:hypothetical protein